LLDALLDRAIRQPGSCLIEVGEDFSDIGLIADLVTEVEVTTSRVEATTGTIIIEDRRKEDGQWIAADSGLFTRWAPIRVSADFHSHVEEVFRDCTVQIQPSDRKSTRLNSSHVKISYAVFCLKKKNKLTSI